MITISIVAAVILIAFVLLLGGTVYAAMIAIRPFSVGKTWWSVVIGDAFTAAGMSALILYCAIQFGLDPVRAAFLAAIPWGCLALTGLPMICGQVIKHELRRRDAGALEAEEGE